MPRRINQAGGASLHPEYAEACFVDRCIQRRRQAEAEHHAGVGRIDCAIVPQSGAGVVDGIEYQRIGAEEYYAQQLFETEELSGYLRSMIDANKSVHKQVIYQSDTELTFVEQLEKNEAIKIYAKLPSGQNACRIIGSHIASFNAASRPMQKAKESQCLTTK